MELNERCSVRLSAAVAVLLGLSFLLLALLLLRLLFLLHLLLGPVMRVQWIAVAFLD